MAPQSCSEGTIYLRLKRELTWIRSKLSVQGSDWPYTVWEGTALPPCNPFIDIIGFGMGGSREAVVG